MEAEVRTEEGAARGAGGPGHDALVPAALLFAAIVLVLFLLAPKGTAIDYAVFRRAGARYLAGEDLYRATEFFSFKYAPVAAAFFAPFSLLPERLGWLALNLLSLLALLGVLRWATRHLGAPGLKGTLLWLAMTAPYYGHLFWLGQTDGLVLGLLVLSEAKADGRPFWSGALWALACLVKPPFLVLFLAVTVLRQWRRLAGLAGGAFLWLTLGALRYGLSGGLSQLRAWFTTLSQSTPALVCWEFNQSAFALACTYLAPPGTHRFAAAIAGLALAAAVAGLALYARMSRAEPERARFALVGYSFYLGAFLSPLGWNTNLVVVLPLAGALAVAAGSAPSLALRRAATAGALGVAALNALDLLVLPFHLFEDAAMTLLRYRQYGLAGMALVAFSLCTLLARPREAEVPVPAGDPA